MHEPITLRMVDYGYNRKWFDDQGRLHQIDTVVDGDTVITYQAYFNNKGLHNATGPARIWDNGTVEYYLDGIYYEPLYWFVKCGYQNT